LSPRFLNGFFGQKGCGDFNPVVTFSVSAAFESGLGQRGGHLFLALCLSVRLYSCVKTQMVCDDRVVPR
jgi:hypothetical protein